MGYGPVIGRAEVLESVALNALDCAPAMRDTAGSATLAAPDAENVDGTTFTSTLHRARIEQQFLLHYIVGRLRSLGRYTKNPSMLFFCDPDMVLF